MKKREKEFLRSQRKRKRNMKKRVKEKSNAKYTDSRKRFSTDRERVRYTNRWRKIDRKREKRSGKVGGRGVGEGGRRVRAQKQNR